MNCMNVCDLNIADGLKTTDSILIMKDGKAYRMTLAEFQSYAAVNPNIITDTTLTHAGQAADAEAVGIAMATHTHSLESLGFKTVQLIKGAGSGTSLQLSHDTGWSDGYRFYIVSVSIGNDNINPVPYGQVLIAREEMGSYKGYRTFVTGDAVNAKFFAFWYSGDAIYFQGVGAQQGGGGAQVTVYGVI